MLKNKFIIFIILMLALLSISAASAEDSSLNTTQDTVCVDLMNDSSTEAVASDYSGNNSLSEDNDNLVASKTFDDLNTANAGKTVNGTFKTNSSGNYVVNDSQELANNSVYVDCVKGNDNNTGTSWNSSVQSIGKAMEIVSNNGRVYLADGTYNMGRTVNIDKTVAIVGNGTKTLITNNKNEYSVFYISANNVAIYNCTFVNNTARVGSVIYNDKSTNVTVNGCTFVNNHAISGGAIVNHAINFTVVGCTFVNNSGDYGAAILNWGDDFTVSNSTFINNSVTSNGGVICTDKSAIANDNWWGNNTPDWKQLFNGTVTHDTYAVLTLTATDDSVAINFYRNGTNKVLPISRSFTLAIGDNVTTGEIVNGSFKTSYTTPKTEYNITASSDNEKLSISFLKNVYVDYEKGSDLNTGASWDSAVKTVKHAMEVVLANGTIYLADGTHSLSGQLTINKTLTVAGNGSKTIITTNHMNRAFYVNVSNVAIYNCTFAENIEFKGGAIYNNGENFTLSGCTFVNNVAMNGTDIYNNAVGFTVSNSSFVGDTAKIMYSSESCKANDNWWGTNSPDFEKLANVVCDNYAVLTLTATNKNITINFYRNGTTTVLPISRDFTLNITGTNSTTERIVDGTFKTNYTAPAGEYNITVRLDNQNLTVSFLNNVYVDYEEGNDLNTGANWTSAVKTIKHAMEVVLAEGKIYLANGTHEVDSQITVAKPVTIVGNGSKTVITNNRNGCGVFELKSSAGDVAIYNCTFVNNTNGDGSAVINNRASLSVVGCTFINNTGYLGGVIYSLATFSVSNSAFVNNTADQGNVIYTLITCNANDNWWGNNTPDWKKLVYGNVTHESYAVLDLTATDDSVAINFYKNGTNEVLPISRSFTLAIGNNVTTEETVNGSFKTNYTAPAGSYDVIAIVDNEKLVTNFVNCVYVDYVKGNDTNNGYSWNNSVKTIKQAMDIILPNGRIYLADGTHVVSDRITIDKNVTVVGNGSKTVITNNNNGKGVFYVTATNMAIYNCTFVNNSVNGDGGAIYRKYVAYNFTVSGCTFVNNSANRDGGAIHNDGFDFTVSSCTFVNNSADGNGGAINNGGVGFTVSNSTFVNNKAYRGNAIYNSGSCKANDNWWGNNTPDWEKLVYGTVTHDTYAVLDLTANSNSVAINFYRNGTDDVLSISRDVKLAIGDLNITGRIVDGTFKTYYDAPKTEYNITASVDNQTLAISFLKDVYVDYENGMDNNTGDNWASAVKTIAHALDVVLANGTIHLADGTHKVDSRLTIDKAVCVVGNGTKTVITTNNHDGVFWVTVANVSVYNCTFVNNTAEFGGAIYNGGANFTVGGCIFINNAANQDGGAIFNYGDNSDVKNSTFVNNYAKSYGGAIANFGNYFTVNNSIFVNNTAYYDDEIYSKVSCEAVDNWWGTNNPKWDDIVTYTVGHNAYAVLDLTANVETISINFYRNGTTVVLPISRDVKLAIGDNLTVEKIVNGTFKTNYTAPIIGIYSITASVDNQELNVTVDNAKIYVDYEKGNDNNTGTSWASAVKTISKAMELVPDNGRIYLADGIHEVESLIEINKTMDIVGNGTKTFITNNGNGNGVFHVTEDANNVAIYNCTFANNTADWGSAIWNEGVNFTVSGCTFVNNSADKYAGAIYNYGVNFTVTGCTFVNNSADGDGGAIDNEKDGFIVNNSIFINNNGDDGIVYNYYGSFAMNNCTFVNNTAYYGGAIYNNNGDLIISNSEFSNNTAYKGIIYNDYWATLKLNNNTFCGISENKTYIYNSGSVTLYSVDITVLGNETVKVHPGETIKLCARVNCDGVSVAGGTLYFIIDGKKYSARNYDNGDYMCNYYVSYFDEPKVVSASYDRANGEYVKNATLNCVVETFTDLKNAIDASNVISLNSNITMAADEKEEFVNGITIDKNIIIIGNGFTIDANNSGRIFNITDGHVISLNNVTLANGKNINGGAIYNAGNLTLRNVEVINNSAEDGGAIYNSGGSFTANNSIFTNNTADKGVIYNDGVISLNNNTYSIIGENKTYIYNMGTLPSCVITVLGNKTVNKYYGDNITLFATITYDGASVGGQNLYFIIDSLKYRATAQDNGNYTYIYTLKFSGEETVYASYGGVNENNVTLETGILNVSKYNPMMNVTADNITFGQNLTIDVDLPTDTKGNISIMVDRVIYTKTIENGSVNLVIENLAAGLHAIFVKYPGSEKYLDSEVIKHITVAKAVPTLNVAIGDIDYGGVFTIKANLTGVSNIALTGDVIVEINNKKHVVSVENGQGSLEVNDKLPANEYPFTATWDGNDNYTTIAFSDAFKVNKINSTISVSVDDISVGQNATIIVKLASDATGDVEITIGNKTYNVTIKDGIATKSLTNLKAGNYTVDVIFSGDNNYNIASNKTNFTVSKVSDYDMDVTIPAGVKFAEEGIIKVDLPGDATGEVIVTVDGENYTAEVENATAQITIPLLSVGLHNITATYSGDDKYNPITKQGSITILPNDVVLAADNVVMLYHDGTRLVAKLTDTFDNPIANTPIFFTLNGIIYNRTTDENGTASMALNLDSGNYTATVTYFGNSSYNAATTNANITITPSIIGHDIVKMYQNDTQFNATFLDNYGNPLVNTTVKFNINGVFYERNTTENGVAKLNINLRPGNYTLTAYNPVTGEQQGFNVLVKTLIIASDLTKYYNNGTKFKATIYNKNGTLAVNKSVTFNINGVFYERNTTENGTVDLAITLRPGDYIITTTVDGLEVSNNIKVLPTLITSDLAMNYHDGSTFNATALDGQGNPLANETVKFNVNGVFYNKITGDDGVASLTINLNKGKYIITSMWDNYHIGNKITIS